jgi:hypothetical protein
MGTQTAAIPITVRRLLNPNAVTPPSDRYLEAAQKTFLRGVPVRIVSGYIDEMDTIDGVDDVIAGICDEFAHNLTTAGTAESASYGSVQNQSSAKLIAVGTPLSDGRIQVIKASDDVIFMGKTDDAHTTVVTDVGSIFGLTKDGTTNQWFVDTTISVAGSGACVEVVEVIDLGVVGGRVGFRVTRAYQQLFT